MSALRGGLALVLTAGTLALSVPARAADEKPADERESELFGPSTTTESPEIKADSAKTGDDARPVDLSREDEMFGESATTTAPERSSTPPAQAAGEAETGLEPVDTKMMSEKMDETNDKLAIGARIFQQAEYGILERGGAGTFALRTPTLLDVYLDGRPSDRLRTYVRGRLTYTPSNVAGAATSGLAGAAPQQLATSLDQMWIKFDAGRKVFFTVGKQRLKWGAGRFWNPTDFLNQQRLDPLAVIDVRLGVNLIKVHVPVESLGWNFYGLVDLQDVAKIEDAGGALRAEIVLGSTEFALSAAARRRNPLRLGADFSTALGLFDVRGELSLTHPLSANSVRTLEGELDLPNLSFPTFRDRKGDWIAQALLGAEVTFNYTDEDTFSLGAEYFYNGLGYDDPLYPALIFAGALTPLYNGKHYAAAYALLSAPGSWNDTSFILSTLGNLSDGSTQKVPGSYLTRFDVRHQALTYLGINVYAAYHYGHTGELKLGFEIPPSPLDPRLANGLSIVPPRMEIGAGLTLNL